MRITRPGLTAFFDNLYYNRLWMKTSPPPLFHLTFICVHASKYLPLSGKHQKDQGESMKNDVKRLLFSALAATYFAA